MADSSFRYRVGVDVGYRSLGLAAIEYSAAGQPLRILNAQVIVHDAGIDPEENKTAKTRKETAGVARRVRRMIQRKAKRLKKLDQFLKELGFPTDPYPQDDPYLPWRYRAELATHPIADPKELAAKLSVALRHIARHRGWRSPYDRVENLFTSVEPSTELIGLRERTAAVLHRDIPEAATPGQIVAAYALTPSVKLRGPKGHLQGKLRQSDYAEEIRQIAAMQGFDEAWSRRVIKVVFAAESPRGSALERVGFDPLPGQEKQRRAAKADSSFQRYRIASIICNIRITVPGQSGSRSLTSEEKTQIFDYLWNAGAGTEPSWDDVAAVIGVQRGNLEGVSKPTPDGERAGTRPPVYVTSHRILQCKSKKLQQWWAGAGQAERDCMIETISFGGAGDDSTPESESVNTFLEAMEETELAELDIVSSDLPAGRAAYSADSMRRLTDRMLSTADDLHAARMHEFDVSDNWAPPAEAIGAPVGNPAVDRVTKAFARWLQAVEREWGVPESVTIEHVRDGLLSEKSARELTRDIEKRRSKNEANLARMLDELGTSAQGRRWDYVRFEAVTRQNSQCAYCGGHIDFRSAEMDHIVPQAGPGSNSRRENLLAACHRCNLAKGKIPFAAWAASCGIPGVSVKEAVDRVKHWTDDPKVPKKQALKFRNSVIARLKRTDADPEIDARSMESIAWMATELRHRVAYHFARNGAETRVDVYRGGITSEARKASGLEWSLPYYGASGKTRLDRRHHAVDAAVLTLLDASVAKTLAERVSIMRGEKYLRTQETWKTYSGASPAAQQRFSNWKIDMDSLQHLLVDAFVDDEIHILQPLRLRFADGSLHKDTINKLDKRFVSDEFSLEQIDRASTPALWCALTRQPDFDPKVGLPANPERKIRVKDKHLGPDDEILFFPSNAASILVRGGSAEIGATIHHARVYRIPGKKPSYGMVRVFRCDLAAHQDEDLFSVELPPQSVSMRDAERKVRDALAAGTAEYLGWMVVGDELQIDMSKFTSGIIGKFNEAFPRISKWRLDGFKSNSRLRMRPVLLSSEGLDSEASESAIATINYPGWCPSLGVVCTANLSATRRDTLGRKRTHSDHHLPVSWSV